MKNKTWPGATVNWSIIAQQKVAGLIPQWACTGGNQLLDVHSHSFSLPLPPHPLLSLKSVNTSLGKNLRKKK